MMKKFQSEHVVLLGVCGFLLALALTTDYHRVVDYLFSDEAVYYMMAQSLAFDQDMEYTRQDLQRVYAEGWYAGPQGVYLTKTPDGTIYYGKYLAYSLFLAPFIALFGLKGFLLLNMIFLGLMIWMAWVYLRQFNPSNVALLLALTFFLLSASFLYTFWLTPETFNMFLITLGMFLWLYQREAQFFQKYTAKSSFLKWLFANPNGRLYLAPIPIAIAYASKITNVLFLLPIVADLALTTFLRRNRTPLPDQSVFRRMLPTIGKIVLVCVVFGIVAQLFLGLQVFLTGHSNQYAGDRRMFIWNFPFTGAENAWERGIRHSNEDYWKQSFFLTPKTLLYNIYYYVFGRFTGLFPYFICSLLAVYYFLRQFFTRQITSHVPIDRWRRVLLLVAIIGHIGAYIIIAPINYHGGSGAFGNRFFLNIYPAFLFLVTIFVSRKNPRRVPFSLLGSWLIGSLFLAQPLLNPFQTSYYPPAPAFKFPYRFLPVELTMINAIPTHVNNHLMQAVDDTEPRYRLYYFDENISDIGSREWWVLGERTSEFAILAYAPQHDIVVTLMNGPVPNEVEVSLAGTTQVVRFTAPGERRQVVFPLKWSMPYFDSSVYPGKIRSKTGFVPKFEDRLATNNDVRYLGCRVSLSLNPLEAAKVYLEQGQPQEALRMLDPVINEHTNDLEWRYVRGKAYFQAGQPDAALSEFRSCETLLPTWQAAGEFPKVYEAEALQRNTGAIVADTSASNGQKVVFQAGTDKPGFVVFGPYVEFPPGDYQVTYRLRVENAPANITDPAGAGLFYDVYSSKYGMPLTRRPILTAPEPEQPAEVFKDYSLNFTIAYPTPLEFRVEATGDANVAVDSITVAPRLLSDLHQSFAQAAYAVRQYAEAEQSWQKVLAHDAESPAVQLGALQTLFALQRWDEALTLIQRNAPRLAHHSGVATYLDPSLSGFSKPLPVELSLLHDEVLARFVPQHPTRHQFGETLALVGYDLKSDQATPGGQLAITYYWQALRPMMEDYTMFVHFTRKEDWFDPETTTRINRKLRRPVTNMFQHDHDPVYGAYPTSQWLPPEFIREHYTLSIPANLQPGTYEISLGVWNPFTGIRLETPDGKTKVTIGEIRIKK